VSENVVILPGFKPLKFARALPPVVISIKGKSKFYVRIALSGEASESTRFCQDDYVMVYVSSTPMSKKIALVKSDKDQNARCFRRFGSVLAIEFPFRNDIKQVIPASALYGTPKIERAEAGMIIIDLAGCSWESRSVGLPEKAVASK